MAIVGLGERGRRWAWLASVARGVEVGALVDPRPEVARAARNALALDVPVFHSLSDAVSAGVEGAIVAFGLGQRPRAARMCIALRLHALVEPPLAPSSAEAAFLLLMAGRAGTALRQAFWLGLSPPLRAMRGVLREDRLGRPIGGLLVRLHGRGEDERWETVQLLDALLSLLSPIEPRGCRREGYALLLDFEGEATFGLAIGPSGDSMEGLLLVCEHGALLWDGRTAFVREGRRGLRWRPEDPLGFRWPERGEGPGGKFEPLPPDPGPSGEEAALARFRAEVEGRTGRADERRELLPVALLEACGLAGERGEGRPQELVERALEEGGKRAGLR